MYNIAFFSRIYGKPTDPDENCHSYIFKMSESEYNVVEEAINNSYAAIQIKKLREVELSNQQGYKIPTYYGTFLFTPQNELCGEEYFTLAISGRRNTNELLTNNLINKYFNETVECINTCFLPADWYDI